MNSKVQKAEREVDICKMKLQTVTLDYMLLTFPMTPSRIEKSFQSSAEMADSATNIENY